MATEITLDFQYDRRSWGRATVSLDVSKILREYNVSSLDALEEEDWRNIVADAEAYAPGWAKREYSGIYAGEIDYGDENIEEERFSDFTWDEPSDPSEPDTIQEARS